MNREKYALDIRNKLQSHDEIMVPTAIVLPCVANKILIQRRADCKRWGLFGGGVKYSETIIQTAKRSLFDETGLETQTLDMFGVFSKYHIEYANHDKVNAFSVAFICKLKSNQIFKPDANSTIEAVWINEEELDEIDFWTPTSKEIAREAFEFMKTKKVIVK